MFYGITATSNGSFVKFKSLQIKPAAHDRQSSLLSPCFYRGPAARTAAWDSLLRPAGIVATTSAPALNTK